MKRITVKDIAKEVDLSLGAINKALNNKPGLSAATRKRVLDTADRMGYKVNKVAQGMARNTFNIGIILSEQWNEYYEQLKRGILMELEILRDYNIEGNFYYVSGLQFDMEWLNALRQCETDKNSAIIICPPQDKGLEQEINRIEQSGIQVLLLGSDIEQCNRSLCVQVDNICVGNLAAEFGANFIEAGQKAIVFVGNKDMNNHSEKAKSFCSAAKNEGIDVLGVFETHDDPNVAVYLAKKMLNQYKNIGLIFSATGNYLSICNYIAEQNISTVAVIGMDMYAGTMQYMENGTIKCIISQNIEKQGSKAIRTIYEHCIEGMEISQTIYVAPQLLLKSNAKYYK